MRKRLTLIIALLLTLSGSASAAIALVGTPTTSSIAFGSATITLNYPTGHASGHVAYAYLEGTAVKTITATGWTQIAATGAQNDGWGGYLMYRLLDGTEGASVTFTITATNNVIMGEMRLYSGVNTTTPLDNAAANPQSAVGNTGQPNLTGFTTLQAGDELLFFAANQVHAGAYGTPTSWGNASLINDATNTQAMGGWDFAQTSAGAIGAVTTSGGTAGDAWSAMMVALQPSTTVAPATASVTFQ